MIVEERLVRLHAVIDCLGLISQGGASDGPICHRGSETEGTEARDHLLAGREQCVTCHSFLILFYNTITADLRLTLLHVD